MVELAVLERLCIGNGTEGSNPSLSASKPALAFLDFYPRRFLIPFRKRLGFFCRFACAKAQRRLGLGRWLKQRLMSSKRLHQISFG